MRIPVSLDDLIKWREFLSCAYTYLCYIHTLDHHFPFFSWRWDIYLNKNIHECLVMKKSSLILYNHNGNNSINIWFLFQYLSVTLTSCLILRWVMRGPTPLLSSLILARVTSQLHFGSSLTKIRKIQKMLCSWNWGTWHLCIQETFFCPYWWIILFFTCIYILHQSLFVRI